MNQKLAYGLLEMLDRFALKQESNAERKLMQKISKLFNQAASEIVRNIKDREFYGPSDILGIEQKLNALKTPIATAALSETSALLSPENRQAFAALRDRAFTASQRTMNRIIGNVTQSLTQSFQEGLGVNEMARNLSTEFRKLRDFELRRIARTESHTAQMNERFLNNQRSALVDYHEWITAGDDRVRDGEYGGANHVELQGQIVAVGNPFQNGLTYPGDMSGDIEEWINCRCRLVPFIMPRGKIAPPGKGWFTEGDLVDIEKAA